MKKLLFIIALSTISTIAFSQMEFPGYEKYSTASTALVYNYIPQDTIIKKKSATTKNNSQRPANKSNTKQDSINIYKEGKTPNKDDMPRDSMKMNHKKSNLPK